MNLLDYVLLNRIKIYGKISGNEEDELILQLIEAAKDTLNASGVPRDSDSELYSLAIERLVMHYYENREEIGANQQVPMGMNWMINHLKYGI